MWLQTGSVETRELGSCLLYRRGHSGETTLSLVPSSPSSLLPLSYRKCVARALPTGDDASVPGSVSHKPQAFVLALFPIARFDPELHIWSDFILFSFLIVLVFPVLNL